MKAGWQTRNLNEVAEVFDGPHATPKTVDLGPIFLGIGALQDGVINLGETRHVTEEDFKQWTRRVRPRFNDVVFSYETRLGQAAIIPEGLDCCLGRRMGLVRFKPGFVDPRFFLYQYLSPLFRKFLTSQIKRGATVDRISIKEFPSFPIAVPPFSEQQRIVAILDEAFDGIATAKANAEKNLQNAKEVFDGYLQNAYASKNLVTIASLASDITDGDHQPPPKAASGVPFITISNIIKGTREIDFSDTFMVADAYFDNLKPNKRPRSGDVLFTVTGSFGIPVLVKDETRFCFQRHIGIIRPKPDTDSLWLNYALLSPQAFKQANDGATGTAQKTVSLGVLREIKVPKLGIKDQRILAAKIQGMESEIKNLETIYKQKLVALDELKQSLLHQAFTGHL